MGSVVLALVDIARPRQYLKQVKMLEMNIDTLLQAAEYIERREREAEHGYASTLPTSQSQIIVTTKNQRLKTSSTKTALRDAVSCKLKRGCPKKYFFLVN